VSFDPTTLLLSVLISAVGVGFLLYGKKQQRAPQLVVGIVLIGYKLLLRLGGAEVIGPVLMGMAKPVNVLQQGASLSDVVNLAAMTAVRAQNEIVY